MTKRRQTTGPAKRRTKTPVIRHPHSPGTSPGTVKINPSAAAPKIRVIAYGPDDCQDVALERAEDLKGHVGKAPVAWVNVIGLGEEETLRKLAEHFGIHRLALEDVVNTHQRAKVEPYDEHVFLVARMCLDKKEPGTNQVSLFVGAGYVLTFEEKAGDCFEPVRQRILSGRGYIRKSGSDYLTYALLDALVDSYFPLMENVGDRIEDLQDEVLVEHDHGIIGRIHEVKHDLLVIRRALWPHREAFTTLMHEDLPFFEETTHVYLRDCSDHVMQLLDMVETYRELAAGLQDTYLTQVSNRMNDIMKVLTIFAVIFIPITFIAGVYGMNFEKMPELGFHMGYPGVLTIMAVVAGTMLLFFRRKGWLGSSGPPRAPIEEQKRQRAELIDETPKPAPAQRTPNTD
ncbi:MAG: magnesium/cobalt transporter CorA [Planctomycetes bacterium]|nr:magnesium/cobalt transporter CorA [Planctomycetota bacterium]